jgi:hypothetical protein
MKLCWALSIISNLFDILDVSELEPLPLSSVKWTVDRRQCSYIIV